MAGRTRADESAPPRAASPRRPHRVTVWMERLAIVLATAVTLVMAAATTVVLVGTHNGYQAVSMTTGSMIPMIRPGDLAVVQSVDPRHVRVGDVITFRAPVPGTPLVTHRVAAVAVSPTGPVFTTKGDANQSRDPWTTRFASTGWRVVGVIPRAGALIDSLHGDGGRVLIGVLIFVIVFGLLSTPSSRPARERTAGAEAS